MTPEPTTSVGLTATGVGLLIATLGPTAGQYALIVLAALSGAMWPLATANKLGMRSGLFLLFRICTAAVILTAPFAWFLENKYGVPAIHGMSGVAFVIGAIGNGWKKIALSVGDGLVSFLKTFGSK